MKELEQFQVFLKDGADGFMTLPESTGERYKDLMAEICREFGAPNEAVASSLFMRRFGFFITGQFYLLAQGKMWDGPLEEIYFIHTSGGLAFELDTRYLRKRQPGDLEVVLKQFAFPVVERVRKAGHISKLILWENIWGYVIWMYGMQVSDQAKQDVNDLLDDLVWQPEMRKSHFRQFLDGRTFEQSKNDYKRITCCLNKELPGTDKCPYCPLKK